MKLARYRLGEETLIGAVEGQAIARLSGRLDGVGADMAGLIERWGAVTAQTLAAVEERLRILLQL